MAGKFKNYTIDREFKKEAEKYIKMINNKFSKCIADKKINVLKTERLLLSASYLVKKNDIKIFEDVFNSLQDELKKFQFMFSGPWPCYNFIEIQNFFHH